MISVQIKQENFRVQDKKKYIIQKYICPTAYAI